MKIRNKFLFFILLAALCFVSCRKNPYKVSISSIKADIAIKRLEKDLFTLKPEEITVKLPDLKDKYGILLQLFSYAINTGDVNDPSFGDFLVRFCTDKQNNDVFNLTMKRYPDLTTIERNLEDAFRHYKYYFPDKVVPEVFSCITGFNASIITMSGEPGLGIGLDKYLGADCEYYPGLGIYSYMSAKMTPDYIVSDCLYGWGVSQWDFASLNYTSDNVLAEMIHEGKLRYFVRCMLPETRDEIIFGFTPEQMKFCRNNEGQMWQYLIENDLFFKTDQFTIRKLVGDGPFTSYFTNESPGRAAVWLGFRIIESYMNKNRGTSLESLMRDINVQEILEKARYNPQ
jgi:hypothetical protein